MAHTPATVLVVGMILVAGGACADEIDPTTRVRPENATIARLITQATERPATFRREIDAINRTDGLVYLHDAQYGPGVRGCLMHSLQHYSAQAANDTDQVERQTVEAALLLAGQSVAKCPIVLVSITLDAASPGVEAWTSYRADGKAQQIFVYTGSEIFQCASRGKNRQCLLKLASVIVHEVWHIRNGASEEGAYGAQIAFLMGNQGAIEQITAVRMARDRVLEVQKKLTEAAQKRFHDQPR